MRDTNISPAPVLLQHEGSATDCARRRQGTCEHDQQDAVHHKRTSAPPAPCAGTARLAGQHLTALPSAGYRPAPRAGRPGCRRGLASSPTAVECVAPRTVLHTMQHTVLCRRACRRHAHDRRRAGPRGGLGHQRVGGTQAGPRRTLCRRREGPRRGGGGVADDQMDGPPRSALSSLPGQASSAVFTCSTTTPPSTPPARGACRGLRRGPRGYAVSRAQLCT